MCVCVGGGKGGSEGGERLRERECVYVSMKKRKTHNTYFEYLFETISSLSGTFPTKNLTNWTVRYPGRRLSCDVFLKTSFLPRTGEFFSIVPSRPCE